MNRNNVSFNDDDISVLTTFNGYIDFSRSEKPNSKRENVVRKRKLSSSQYKIDNSNDESVNRSRK
jgi:hypothetical protein